jgi:hypothetical protein
VVGFVEEAEVDLKEEVSYWYQAPVQTIHMQIVSHIYENNGHNMQWGV